MTHPILKRFKHSTSLRARRAWVKRTQQKLMVTTISDSFAEGYTIDPVLKDAEYAWWHKEMSDVLQGKERNHVLTNRGNLDQRYKSTHIYLQERKEFIDDFIKRREKK